MELVPHETYHIQMALPLIMFKFNSNYIQNTAYLLEQLRIMLFLHIMIVTRNVYKIKHPRNDKYKEMTNIM